LVVAPEAWNRDETLAGPPPCAPESVAIEGYTAHFFECRDAEAVIAFIDEHGLSVRVGSAVIDFQWVGKRLPDVTPNIGPLYGGGPPCIRADGGEWSEVKTIVVGEEGPGQGKWRSHFEPVPGQTEQRLPSELAQRQGGWYFLRFYNASGELIDSTDFRFVRGLKEVSIPRVPALPGAGGHEACPVQFMHDSNVHIQPMGAHLSIERHAEVTTASIPADPRFDEISWKISWGKETSLTFTTRIDRLWWALGEEKGEVGRPTDRPVTLTPDDLRAASTKGFWLWLPRNGLPTQVYAGFERASARRYLASKGMAFIPMREFCDSQQLLHCVGTISFRLWLASDAEVVLGRMECPPGPVVTGSSDAPPVANMVCVWPAGSVPLPELRISERWDLRRFCGGVRAKSLEGEVCRALHRLRGEAPAHCLAEIDRLKKAMDSDDWALWQSLCLIDMARSQQLLPGVSSALANLEVPDAARRDIREATRQLEKWWYRHGTA
jgi:hypothetical protein